MVEPDDFDLSPAATLAHVACTARCPSHAALWKTWTAAVWAREPALVPQSAGDLDPVDGGATHSVESVHSVRIGAALVLPADRSTTIRAGLVTTHGYESPERLAPAAASWQAVANRGVAVLVVRVRGYPGSMVDVPGMVDWLARDGRPATKGSAAPAYQGGGLWIAHGLDQPISESGIGCEWSLAYGVADVVNAARALRRWIEHRAAPATRHGLAAGRVPLYLHGESFGGGLAVLAASVLAEQHQPIDRLVLGVPSLGDWRWRLTDARRRCRLGSARHVVELLSARRDREESIHELLGVFDAAIHARRVTCPVLCKLATRDEVVPAPAAAAVFNALGAAPAEKWRFCVRYGHFDGGLSDARRHALFERVAGEFLDPTRDVHAVMKACEPMMTSGPRPSHAPSAPGSVP